LSLTGLGEKVKAASRLPLAHTHLHPVRSASWDTVISDRGVSLIMAVELRCPECRAKLRLPVAPEADSEIECPKCGHVFPTDENVVHAGSADAADDKPKKKKSTSDDADEKPKKDEKKGDKAAGEGAKKPKKRKWKKKQTNKVAMWAVIGGAVLFVG